MRYGYWMPVFGGWLRNVPDEKMEASWDYARRLTLDAERRVFVTEDGKDKSRRVMASMTRLDARFLRDLPPDRATELRRILVGIIDARL